MNTFLWFDYETLTSNNIYNRPVQFSCIRTNLNFKILNKINIYCKLSYDFIPDPKSVLINNITPQFVIKYGYLENIFSKIIKNEMSKKNTINIGYNNINFDNIITRFMFWRNLLNPYNHEWKNNCKKLDIIYLIYMIYVLDFNSIKWLFINKNVSFKLENIAKLNNINYNPHNAIEDVKCIINITKLIKKKSLKIYKIFLKINKKLILNIVNKNNNPLIYINNINYLNIIFYFKKSIYYNNIFFFYINNFFYKFSNFINKIFLKIKYYFKFKKINFKILFFKLPLLLININKIPIIINNNNNILSMNITKKYNIIYKYILYNYIYILNLPKFNKIFNYFLLKIKNNYNNNNYKNADYLLYDNNILINNLNKKKIKINNIKNKILYELNIKYKARNFYKLLTKNEYLNWKFLKKKDIKNGLIKLNEFLICLNFLKLKNNLFKRNILNLVYKYTKFITNNL